MARNADGRWISIPVSPGHPYDDGIYRALPGTVEPAPLTISVEDLPGYCGRLRGHGGTGPVCRRVNLVYQLHTLHAEILSERARITRCRSAHSRENLIGFVEFAQRRLAYYLTAWHLPECGHGEHAFAEATHDTEQALPACTC
jgi:hypothetical protein